jgi:hypothetical protein
MSYVNLQFIYKNNLFRKIYILIILLFTSLLFSYIFGETFYFCCVSQNKVLHSTNSIDGKIAETKTENLETKNLPLHATSNSSSFNLSNSKMFLSEQSIENFTNYGGVSVPDSRSAVEDVLSSNNSSIVQVANIKNILLDTKVGTKDNLSKSDSLYYDQIPQLFTEVNDSTISSEKQLTNIQSIMKQVNPTIRLPGNTKD